MAANGLCGDGKGTMISPPDTDKTFSIATAEIATFDEEVSSLLMDLTILHDMAHHLPNQSPRAHEALYAANLIVNTCDPFDKTTFPK